jgi:hypothetical protein
VFAAGEGIVSVTDDLLSTAIEAAGGQKPRKSPGSRVTVSASVKRLGVNVFTAPAKAVVGERPRPFGEPLGWDPITSTLIYGEYDAVLVDTLTTVTEAEALADWVCGRQSVCQSAPSPQASHQAPSIPGTSRRCIPLCPFGLPPFDATHHKTSSNLISAGGTLS